MKTYKTWEAIKMLEENSKLEFTNGRVKLWACENYLEGAFRDKPKNLNGNVCLSDEWTLVPQEVSFMDAVKAYGNGQDIYCIEDDRQTIYRVKRSPGLVDKKLVDSKGLAISSSEILEGKWYIGELND